MTPEREGRDLSPGVPAPNLGDSGLGFRVAVGDCPAILAREEEARPPPAG